ncbi:hypothetical protein [Streptomyces sp. NPDC046805]|uniref:hypothetical protein n=1 Tax=Streptomyces sp. NPDC046805 TaxID=3155134 RepID=UPI0033D88C36
MRLTVVLGDLHERECGLARHLADIAQRHRADHEVHHVARDLSNWCRGHAATLAEVGRPHGLDRSALETEPRSAPSSATPEAHALSGRLAERADDDTGLRLLYDLRQVCTDATGVRLDWEMVGQAAQALRDPALLDAAQSCGKETQRIIQWADGKLKEASPQVLST